MKRLLWVAMLSALFATDINVELNATLYLPKNSDGSLPKMPVIFTLTPYISDTYHARGAYFASHGYVFASRLWMFAAAEILAANSSLSQMNHVMDTTWLSGWPRNHSVTAKWPCGAGSYAGFDQWATAKEFPPREWRMEIRRQL